jgi:acetyl-CoA acetyltransferase
MNALRDKYAIVATGKSRLGQVGANSLSLLEEAIKNALDEAGLTSKEVDGLVVRGPDDVYSHHQLIAARLGIDVDFSTSLDNGGASQILSLILAVMAIEAGLASVVVCSYGRDSWTRTHQKGKGIAENSLIPAAQRPREHGPEFGHFGAVSQHAFGARRHMYEYGTTRDDFAAIAMAFREHALRNPDAMMKKSLSLEDYQRARLIVDPFGLFDCSLNSDGAGAVVVTSTKRAKSLRQRPVLIKGFATHNNTKGWILGDHMLSTGAVESGLSAWPGSGPRMSIQRRSMTASPIWSSPSSRTTDSARRGRVVPLPVPARCDLTECRPVTLQEVNFLKLTWKACCRSLKERDSCRASTNQTGKCPMRKSH